MTGTGRLACRSMRPAVKSTHCRHPPCIALPNHLPSISDNSRIYIHIPPTQGVLTICYLLLPRSCLYEKVCKLVEKRGAGVGSCDAVRCGQRLVPLRILGRAGGVWIEWLGVWDLDRVVGGGGSGLSGGGGGIRIEWLGVWDPD